MKSVHFAQMLWCSLTLVKPRSQTQIPSNVKHLDSRLVLMKCAMNRVRVRLDQCPSGGLPTEARREKKRLSVDP
jgi:hypothetical protein